MSQVYGGYCYFPEHPLADMHGITRFCVRVKSSLEVRRQLERYGVHLFSIHSHFWGESKSVIEAEVTDRRIGDVFFCFPNQAYMATDRYQHDPQQMLQFREERQRVARAEGHQVAAAGRRKDRIEFP